MGPCTRISCSIISRADKALASLSGKRRTGRDSTLLRSVGKHFDEIVVQAIVELALQMPGELGMLEVDQHFDYAVVLARGKSKQRMLVEPQVIGNFLQGVGHGSIVLRRSVLSSQFSAPRPLLRTESRELRTALRPPSASGCVQRGKHA